MKFPLAFIIFVMFIGFVVYCEDTNDGDGTSGNDDDHNANVDDNDSNQACSNVNVNFTLFDFCSFAQYGLQLVVGEEGRVFFSLGTRSVPKCNSTDSGTVWATYVDWSGDCYEVATEDPEYTLYGND